MRCERIISYEKDLELFNNYLKENKIAHIKNIEYNTIRKYQPTMRWIDQQNIILQNNYYNSPNNIWY